MKLRICPYSEKGMFDRDCKTVSDIYSWVEANTHIPQCASSANNFSVRLFVYEFT